MTMKRIISKAKIAVSHAYGVDKSALILHSYDYEGYEYTTTLELKSSGFFF